MFRGYGRRSFHCVRLRLREACHLAVATAARLCAALEMLAPKQIMQEVGIAVG